MDNEEIIKKWSEKLSEINEAIECNWSAMTDDSHQLRKKREIILESLNDLKQLIASSDRCVPKGEVCEGCGKTTMLQRDNLCEKCYAQLPS